MALQVGAQLQLPLVLTQNGFRDCCPAEPRDAEVDIDGFKQIVQTLVATIQARERLRV